MVKQYVPVDVKDLLPVLDRKLLNLLKSLTPEEWETQTIARLWKVKDVAAHLLDGNIRILSIFRDGFFGEKTGELSSRRELVSFLNGLNADWVRAMKRVSPQMLILLHEATGPVFCDYLRSLPLFGKSALAVDWAGETESRNWMEIAREYTEKWLHQQQIRDAVRKPGLMTRELYYPFIDIFMLALPHTYSSIAADEGTVVKVTVTTEIGGFWALRRRTGKWILDKELPVNPDAEVILDPDTSWKLFSKSLRPEQVRDKVTITGNQALGNPALNMVSVMA